MATINQVKEHPVMVQVLADSFGGIMYDVANRDKYDTTEVLALWNSLTPAEQEVSGGIIKGAIDFMQGAI